MRSYILAVATGVVAMGALSGSAGAQGVGSGPWNGFYLGGHVGYGFQFPDTKIDRSEAENAIPRRDRALGSDGRFAGDVDTDTEGFIGGLHGGYNFQFSNLVVGIEGDYDFGELDGSGTGRLTSTNANAINDPPNNLVLKNSLEGLSSVRGRLGYTFGSLLAYGTGGVAWADWRGSATTPDGIGPGAEESGTLEYGDDLLLGWVAGGGVEYKLFKNLSVRAEYMHYDFGRERFENDDEIGNLETVVGSQKIEVDQIRIGATFHAD